MDRSPPRWSSVSAREVQGSLQAIIEIECSGKILFEIWRPLTCKEIALIRDPFGPANNITLSETSTSPQAGKLITTPPTPNRHANVPLVLIPPNARCELKIYAPPPGSPPCYPIRQIIPSIYHSRDHHRTTSPPAVYRSTPPHARMIDMHHVPAMTAARTCCQRRVTCAHHPRHRRSRRVTTRFQSSR